MNFELDHRGMEDPASAGSSTSEDSLDALVSLFHEGGKELPMEVLLAFQKHRSGELSDEPDWDLLLNMKNGSLSGAIAELEMSDDEQLFLTLLYGCAILMAVAGNLAVILVFLFGRRWNSDLSIFLVNLAFSDIVLSVFCMPFTMSQVVKHHWQFSDALCPIVLFLQLSSVIASVYTLVAIGVDRYLFVTRPLKARLTKRKGKLVIGCIWIFALALSSVQLAVVKCIEFVHNGNVYKDCQESWPSNDYRLAYTITVALLTYIIPLGLLMYTYIRVGRILWHRRPPGEIVLSSSFPPSLNSAGHAEERRIKSKQRVVKMLVVIVLVFAICWFPLHLFFLVIDFFPEVVKLWRWSCELCFSYTFLAIHFLAMSSSYVNPLIYSFMNQNFRSDMRQIWHRTSSAIKRAFRRWGNHGEGYDSEDDESIQPFRKSPNSGLKRSSSTPPPVQEYLQRIGPPYPLIEQLRGRTGSECSKSECQACAAAVASSQSGRSRSRERSSAAAARIRKEDAYG